MADITHNDSVVTESKLKEFYEDIKPFLGCPAYLTSEGNAEYYSTDEKVIGRWTDGKPIYQKTFLFSSLITISNTAWTPLPIKISDINLDIILDYKIGLNGGSSSTHNAIYSCNLSAEIPNGQYIQALAGRDGSSIYADYLVLQYTKTTDSAATTIQEDPNEYSTNEKIIGKWIDGKPIYQKTITGTISTNKTILNIAGLNLIGVPQFRAAYSEGYVFDSRTIDDLDFYTNGNNLIITDIGGEFLDREFIVTIQYTKTTD